MFLKKIIFTIYAVIWTILIGIGLFPITIISHKGACFVGSYWCKGMMFGLKYICNITYEIENIKNIPNGAAIIAAKHQSMWDTMIFLSLYQSTCYILKKELVYIPIYGQYSPAMGMIPIDRKGGVKSLKKMLQLTKERLNQGRKIVIFPEGTRVNVGEFKGYQAGISAIYKFNNLPVIPVALNSGLFWPKNKLPIKSGIIKMRILEPIEAGLSKEQFLLRLEQSIEPSVKELENNV